jgi:hypothetical protein
MLKQIEIKVSASSSTVRTRAHLVEQSAFARSLWAKEKDGALGVTEEF